MWRCNRRALSRHRDDRDARGFGITFQTADRGPAVNAGQHHIHQDEIRIPVSCKKQALGAVAGDRDDIALTFEDNLDQIGEPIADFLDRVSER